MEGSTNMNSDAAFELFTPIFDRAFVAVQRAGKRYDNLLDKIDHSPRSKASLTNDYAFKEILVEFDEDPNIRAHHEPATNSRLISVHDAALLWVRKVDSQRIGSKPLTPHGREMVAGQMNFDFLPQVPVVVCGYQFDEKMDLLCLSFSPPCYGRAPIWWIDLEPGDARIVEMRPPTTGTEIIRTSSLKITRGGRQMGLNGIQS
jgi:hypothetical protein